MIRRTFITTSILSPVSSSLLADDKTKTAKKAEAPAKDAKEAKPAAKAPEKVVKTDE